MDVEKWFGCYRGTRRDLFTPESNQHPAKMAVALCYRIFEHGRQKGYWKPGDWILDPMCGIGTTLICGLSLGYSVVGVELESHFARLCNANLAYAWSKGIFSSDQVRLIQGDARRLQELLAGVDGVLCSPPYATDAPKRDAEDHNEKTAENQGKVNRHQKLGVSLRGGGYSGAVTSPPYSSEFREQHPGTKGGKVAQEFERGGSFRGYSGAVTSPPYAESLGTDLTHGPDSQTAKASRQFSQIPYNGAISSPPYAGPPGKPGNATVDGESKLGREKGQRGQYTSSPSLAQIGNLKDPAGDIDTVLKSEIRNQKSEMKETYLFAMLGVYRELRAVLKPGGVVCLVTKNPVKAGKIRRLDEDTIRLMEAAGFTLIERKRAMLTEDLGEQMALDGGSQKIRRERKSFFKRLFERKRPDLRVDWEDVLFFRKIEARS
jgi:DNA modification methylase